MLRKLSVQWQKLWMVTKMVERDGFLFRENSEILPMAYISVENNWRNPVVPKEKYSILRRSISLWLTSERKIKWRLTARTWVSYAIIPRRSISFRISWRLVLNQERSTLSTRWSSRSFVDIPLPIEIQRTLLSTCNSVASTIKLPCSWLVYIHRCIQRLAPSWANLFCCSTTDCTSVIFSHLNIESVRELLSISRISS